MKLNVFALLVLLLSAATVQAGNFNFDGCLGCDGEFYDSATFVEFNFDSGAPGRGAIGYGTDGAFDYIYVLLSPEFVNLVYAEGYDAKNSPDGYDKDRAFKKIEDSDSLGHAHPNDRNPDPMIIASLDGSGSISLVVDLISQCVDTTCNSGTGWDTAGVDGSAFLGKDNVSGDNHEPRVVADTTGGTLTAAILGIKSSLSYNIGQIGSTNGVSNFDKTKASSEYENNGTWLNYVGYEFKFTKDLVGAVEEIGAHASPELRKLDGTCIGCGACTPGTPGCGGVNVSEPGTLALFSSLLLVTVLQRRRKIKTERDSSHSQ